MGQLGKVRLDTMTLATSMVCLRLYSLLGTAGYAGLDGGLRAMERSRGGAARRNAIRHRRPHTQPGMLAAGVGFWSGELEHASSRSKYLKRYWSRTQKESRASLQVDRRSNYNLGDRSSRRRTWRS
jgi:hypothetical protein